MIINSIAQSFFSLYKSETLWFQSVMDSNPRDPDHRGQQQQDQLSVEQIQEFRKAFKLFDSDNSGTISAQELILVMENLNMNPNEKDISGLLKVRSDISRVRNCNWGWHFFPFKCCVSQLSMDRFGKNFGGLMILGQVKSSPNVCSFGPQRAEKHNIWRGKNTNLCKLEIRTLDIGREFGLFLPWATYMVMLL